MIDSRQRFSSRVENYIKYRPGYPPEVIETLRTDCHLTPDSIIADVGSGTGISTEMFLRNGNLVYGIEPNRDMREAAEKLLEGNVRFRSIAATAEETTLDSAGVDFVIAGQAFHWFDREQAKVEFVRILKPGGWCVVLFNERLTTTTPFLVDYEQLVRDYAVDYEQVDHRQIDLETIRDFFSSEFKATQFKNLQVFDYAGVEGRLLSSSYMPEPDHPNHRPMLAELKRVFERSQDQGRVNFEYLTKMYYGKLN